MAEAVEEAAEAAEAAATEIAAVSSLAPCRRSAEVGSTWGLRDVSMRVEPGQLMVILGEVRTLP